MTHILAGLGGAFIVYIGLSYVISPQSAVVGFGLPEWPHGDATAFLNIKGARDIVSGLILFALLATRQTRALGWVLLAEAFIPLADMTIVLSYGGSPAAALGIHGLTALYVLAVGGMIAWNERPRKTNAASTR